MNKPIPEHIRAWARAIAGSDRKAFDSLFRYLYPALVHFGFRYTGNKDTACDIVQDAFVILWTNRHSLDLDRPVTAYLYKVVRNKALNHIRDHAREVPGVEGMEDFPDEQSGEDQKDDDTGQMSALLRQWLEDLPERRREAFELSRFEGMDHEEIAGMMNVSSSTVNNHIVASLKYLRDRYRAYQNIKKDELL